ncbi:hypothetical protein RF11_12816 [Thelohanellus kitauei]|uniref:Uncharacterized protein n=1 Tax=Thelohanellus kitauei TaxID=669202 RepID=A0A0C2IX00_THEKT|nr:hypothetical protein RF11_12816 [Thelohanellus kitauei]
MALPPELLIVISVLIIIYLFAGLSYLIWKIYDETVIDVPKPQESQVDTITGPAEDEPKPQELQASPSPSSIKDEFKSDEIVPTPEKQLHLDEVQPENPIVPTDPMIDNSAIPFTETDKYITIYFHLRYNAVSSLLSLILAEVKNFPGPAEGGFAEIQVTVTNLPNSKTKYKTGWKLITKARFDSCVNFFNVTEEVMQAMLIRFRVYGRNKIVLPKLVVECLVPIKECKFNTCMNDSLMYINIPLISPFVFISDVLEIKPAKMISGIA